MIRAVCALLLVPLVACADSDAPERTCVRRFDDQAIRGIVEKAIAQSSLKVERPFRVDVNWAECKYYVTVWRTDPPPSPDSQIELTFDENGDIIPQP